LGKFQLAADGSGFLETRRHLKPRRIRGADEKALDSVPVSI